MDRCGFYCAQRGGARPVTREGAGTGIGGARRSRRSGGAGRYVEPYKITDAVLAKLGGFADTDAQVFNRASAKYFGGRTFLELTDSQREDYLRLIIDGSKFDDKAALKALQRTYRQVRTAVFTIFYQNFPENVVARDDHGVPILKPGDKHQITNPNTKRLVTGWDIAGFGAQMTWEEEEERREKFKKYWNQV
jgi:hypothetical protein